MKKFLRILGFGFMILVLSKHAYAETVFRLFLPADIVIETEQLLRNEIGRVLPSDENTVLLHKAKQPKDDSIAFQRAITQPSDGVIVFVDKPDWGEGWAADIFTQRQGTQPIYSIGMISNPYQFDAQIGAAIADYTRLTSESLSRYSGDGLCLYSAKPLWCKALQANSENAYTIRSVSKDQSAAIQMALTVSAMTQNPNIKRIFLGDIALLPNVQQALGVIGAEFHLGVLGYDADVRTALQQGGLDFALDPQWTLQATIALNALKIYSMQGQRLSGFVRVSPLLYTAR